MTEHEPGQGSRMPLRRRVAAVREPAHGCQDERIADASRAVASKKRGSKRRRKAVAKLRDLHASAMNARRDFAHKLSARIVAENGLVVSEELTVRNMTRSSRGTVEEPGSKVAQKAGLNRSILDAAPSMLRQMLEYKARESGGKYVEISTRKHKPSQTCPACGAVTKKDLSQREHRCECGCVLHRDIAAAAVMLDVGLREAGRPTAFARGEAVDCPLITPQLTPRTRNPGNRQAILDGCR